MGVLDSKPPSAGYSRTRPHGNLRVLRIAVLALFGLLVLRLANMQIVNGAEYAERARNNHIQAQQILPARGLIYDRNGEPLVQNVGVYTATIIPEFLPNPALSGGEEKRRAIYLHLENMLGVPALETQARVAQAEAEAEGLSERPLTIKKHLTHEEALMLAEAEHDMPGVTLTVESGRGYIGGNAFSGILGYIGPQTAEEWARLRYEGYAFNQPVGKTGVESRFERELRGQAGQSANEVNAEGDIINVLDTDEPVAGNSVRLAIDAGLQRYIESLLLDTMDRATRAAVVVMDAQTGTIYALVSIPGYDNNIFGNLEERGDEYEALIEDPRKPLLDQALNPAAPGSTFKLITASAALQEGGITPNTTRNVPSLVKEFIGENGVVYSYFDWRAHGLIDLYDAIAWSSNLYMFQISCGFSDEGIKGLGDDIHDSAYRLSYYARGFGLGKQTGVDIGNDAAGIIPNPEWKAQVHADDNPEDREWYHSDTCFTAVGQGDVLATPLQIARMTGAVANGGKLLKPRVVSEIVSADGEVLKTFEPEWETVPVDPKHLNDVRIGMHKSVLEGAGELAYQPGLDIAGKTGTAEFYRPDGVLDEHAWFTGFYPYDNPKVVVTVYYDLGIGGVQAAPVAGRIFSYFDQNVGLESLDAR